MLNRGVLFNVLPCPARLVQVVEEAANAYPPAHLPVYPKLPAVDPFFILDHLGSGHGPGSLVDDAIEDDVG